MGVVMYVSIYLRVGWSWCVNMWSVRISQGRVGWVVVMYVSIYLRVGLGGRDVSIYLRVWWWSWFVRISLGRRIHYGSLITSPEVGKTHKRWIDVVWQPRTPATTLKRYYFQGKNRNFEHLLSSPHIFKISLKMGKIPYFTWSPGKPWEPVQRDVCCKTLKTCSEDPITTPGTIQTSYNNFETILFSRKKS